MAAPLHAVPDVAGSRTWLMQRAAAALLAAGSLAFALMLAVRADAWATRDWHALWLQDRVVEWGSGRKPFTLDEWGAALAELNEARRAVPNDAAVHDSLGALYMVRGNLVWTDFDARAPFFESALKHFERSAELRPMVAHGWANVAFGRYLATRPIPEIEAAWQRAIQLGPLEDDVQRMMLNVVFGIWDEATPPMRAWVAALQSQPSRAEEIERWAKYYEVTLPPR